ncbi:uncharacterized protein F4807DRAFT_441956 [Annulohypoxylon truncatum]|uniref:uncharacterized protein n=1 Tax=Annulohypoxylon truncatum TaxID=327061 RepID=UPI0020083142|nr:uncharacterized protein F4807DRAFT_441956 [Annulohypoxylon truncatum]KAI1205696.1 hypothetical protein F4807DRAFT_441956 [Annulohypoxylon truncatum]
MNFPIGGSGFLRILLSVVRANLLSCRRASSIGVTSCSSVPRTKKTALKDSSWRSRNPINGEGCLHLKQPMFPNRARYGAFGTMSILL